MARWFLPPHWNRANPMDIIGMLMPRFATLFDADPHQDFWD